MNIINKNTFLAAVLSGSIFSGYAKDKAAGKYESTNAACKKAHI